MAWDGLLLLATCPEAWRKRRSDLSACLLNNVGSSSATVHVCYRTILMWNAFCFLRKSTPGSMLYSTLYLHVSPHVIFGTTLMLPLLIVIQGSQSAKWRSPLENCSSQLFSMINDLPKIIVRSCHDRKESATLSFLGISLPQHWELDVNS